MSGVWTAYRDGASLGSAQCCGITDTATKVMIFNNRDFACWYRDGFIDFIEVGCIP
jgi:hypothetical protein